MFKTIFNMIHSDATEPIRTSKRMRPIYGCYKICSNASVFLTIQKTFCTFIVLFLRKAFLGQNINYNLYLQLVKLY